MVWSLALDASVLLASVLLSIGVMVVTALVLAAVLGTLVVPAVEAEVVVVVSCRTSWVVDSLASELVTGVVSLVSLMVCVTICSCKVVAATSWLLAFDPSDSIAASPLEATTNGSDTVSVDTRAPVVVSISDLLIPNDWEISVTTSMMVDMVSSPDEALRPSKAFSFSATTIWVVISTGTFVDTELLDVSFLLSSTELLEVVGASVDETSQLVVTGSVVVVAGGVVLGSSVVETTVVVIGAVVVGGLVVVSSDAVVGDAVVTIPSGSVLVAEVSSLTEVTTLITVTKSGLSSEVFVTGALVTVPSVQHRMTAKQSHLVAAMSRSSNAHCQKT